LHAAASSWPFHLKHVAAQRRGIEIAFQRESSDEFALSLAQFTQIDQGSVGLPTCLFPEFAPRRSFWQLAFVALALGDGPGAKIAALPEWAAWMDEEYLKAIRSPAVRQDPSTSFDHGP
jgi:hypothetical protein